MVVSAQAAFQHLGDFDILALTDINGQNDWVASTGSGKIVLDPAVASNQVLKVLTESGILRKAISTIAQGTTHMLFLRLCFEEHGRYSFGLSNLLQNVTGETGVYRSRKSPMTVPWEGIDNDDLPRALLLPPVCSSASTGAIGIPTGPGRTAQGRIGERI